MAASEIEIESKWGITRLPPEVLPRPIAKSSHPILPLIDIDFFYMVMNTNFNEKYYKNDNGCLQCFPFCPEFKSYQESKLLGNKHEKAGKSCVSPVVASFFHSNPFVLDELIAVAKVGVVANSLLSRFNLDSFFQDYPVLSQEDYATITSENIIGDIRSTDQGRVSKVSFNESTWKIGPHKCRKRKSNGDKSCEHIFEVVLINRHSRKIVGACHSSKFSVSSTRTLHRQLANKKRSMSID